MIFDPQELGEGVFTDAYHYWLSLRVNDQTPCIEAFDLLAVPHLISNFMINDIIDGRIYVRLVGSHIMDETGEDTTGRYLDEWDNVDGLHARVMGSVATGIPYYYVDQKVVWTSRIYKTYSVLGLPLANDTGTVTRLMLLMAFD